MFLAIYIFMRLLKEKIENYEKSAIVNALIECGWVKSRAAKMLGITERMIGYKIKKYRIRREGIGLRVKS
ncbi:MAG: helix-turn-helix domain-containing protein [Nitrospirae bacterium]|nr:helix-turn-helix domain-containing protein [Nitrospirota bacterium]